MSLINYVFPCPSSVFKMSYSPHPHPPQYAHLYAQSPLKSDSLPGAAISQLAQTLVIKELQNWPQSLGKMSMVWADDLPSAGAVL